jgi:hypothetical protein
MMIFVENQEITVFKLNLMKGIYEKKFIILLDDFIEKCFTEILFIEEK